MLTVACVLRSGGDYRPEHVLALAEGVRLNLSLPYKFVCLTDMVTHVQSDGIEAVALPDPWSGWWAKICMFKRGLLTGPILSIDLDTLIVGPLDEIALGHRFTVLRNFHADTYREPDRIGSGLLAWNVDLSAIYDAFRRAPAKFMAEYKTKAQWGDQAFIQAHSPVEPDRWQDKHPGKVVSFKRHVLKARGVPAGASVVCFHGFPRQWQLKPNERAWFERALAAA